MTPCVATYTGDDFDPTILNRRFYGPTPSHWTRYQFAIESMYSDQDWTLSEWLTSHMFGKWTLNIYMTTDGVLVVIGFEKDNDAVMFRLIEGETAWRENVKIF